MPDLLARPGRDPDEEMGVFPDYEAFCAGGRVASAGPRWRPSRSLPCCARGGRREGGERLRRERRRGAAGARPSHPATEDQLFAAEGELNRYVNVYLNDEDVRVLDGLETTVGEQDTLVILPAMAGGR